MDDTIVPIGDPENMEHHHTPGKAEDPSVSCPPEHPFALQ